MGFLDNNDAVSSGISDKLDLVDYECSLTKKFNDPDILNTKYMAEEFGISFDKRKRESDVYLYDGSEEIVICPEPLAFIKEFDDVSDNTQKAHELFLSKTESFQKMKLDHIPKLKGTSENGARMWMNKTLTGINLRPGNLNADKDKFNPVRMCDDNVHGLIAGRTGSGKSVFINALILSLITEYSPWELNLYLADFKKVELSRYMNNADEQNNNIAYTPHVNACAATSEIRYVMSLIKYLVDCMNARQEFFARLGVTKIQEFRNKYGLVLPRVLLIVDEFQQLFTEATNREKEEIQTMLNSITKLGRATGFHLIFASQEMSGTLRGNTLANFKIRMALPCNQQISTDILGNSHAVNLERGYVLINTESGDELKNLKYRVPFIETDKKDDDDDAVKTAFFRFLDEIKLAGRLFDLRYKTASQKFYREELQETERAYCSELDRISEKKNELVSLNQSLFDAVVLGKTVLYSPKPNDKVSFCIEKGRNKGVMIACPEPDNAARVRKLLAQNLLRSGQDTYHFGMELNNLVLERYRIDKETAKFEGQSYYQCDADGAVEFLELIYYLRSYAGKYIDTNEEELQNLKKEEEELRLLLSDSDKMTAFSKYREKKQRLISGLKKADDRILELGNDSKKKLVLPIVRFLEKCSSEIVLIPSDKTKVDFVNLKSYQAVVSAFTVNLDLSGASKKSMEILDSKIAALTGAKVKCTTEYEKIQNDLAIIRNRIFRRAIVFFTDKYYGRVPERTSVSEDLERIYASVESAVFAFKKEHESKKMISDDLLKLSEEKKSIQDALSELEQTPDEIELAKNRVLTRVNAFISYIFDSAYTALGYKKNKPATPLAAYTFKDSHIEWQIASDGLDEKIQCITKDILENYVKRYRAFEKKESFQKVVFWINGLDEIEKIPNQFMEVIRNAINQNILIVGIITSELKDATIRKAFDYAFITGNIEKFYTMFNIKYTKQPLDTIVVNFGIRSKGFDIPFKMYKSNLEEIQAPDFIEQLLNS